MFVEESAKTRKEWENLCAVVCTVVRDIFPFSIELKCTEFRVHWGVEPKATVSFSPRLPDIYILPTGDIELCDWSVNVSNPQWLDAIKERVDACHEEGYECNCCYYRE
jgi:hypothetical protein